MQLLDCSLVHQFHSHTACSCSDGSRVKQGMQRGMPGETRTCEPRHPHGRKPTHTPRSTPRSSSPPAQPQPRPASPHLPCLTLRSLQPRQGLLRRWGLQTPPGSLARPLPPSCRDRARGSLTGPGPPAQSETLPSLSCISSFLHTCQIICFVCSLRLLDA